MLISTVINCCRGCTSSRENATILLYDIEGIKWFGFCSYHHPWLRLCLNVLLAQQHSLIVMEHLAFESLVKREVWLLFISTLILHYHFLFFILFVNYVYNLVFNVYNALCIFNFSFQFRCHNIIFHFHWWCYIRDAPIQCSLFLRSHLLPLL